MKLRQGYTGCAKLILDQAGAAGLHMATRQPVITCVSITSMTGRHSARAFQ